VESANGKTDEDSPVILFADDDDMCLNVGVLMLEKLGYIVLKAHDGLEAIEIFKKNQNDIDLVILDLKMPNNGSTVFHAIKQMDSDTRVILVSGFVESEKIRDLLKQNCDGFIQKPFTMDLLRDNISRALTN
jgi:CheY-like chemotaxis protein